MHTIRSKKVFICVCLLLIAALCTGCTLSEKKEPEPQDVSAPEFLSEPKTVYYKIGDPTPDLQADVTFSDDMTPPEQIVLNIDESSVDYNAPGVYYAEAGITDLAGNSASQKRKIIVYDLPVAELMFCPYDEELDKLVTAVLDEIITEGMTDREKINACYRWCVDNLVYKASRDHSFLDDLAGSVPRFATALITTKKGACYAYAALVSYMMNKLEIPVILLVGKGANVYGGFELHCWNQIYCDGEWWHFDSMYDRLYAGKRNFCLQVSEKMYSITHVWDKKAYPW